MAKTRALVKRRKAIRNIRKITKTMELIATARFKKAMQRPQEADAFTRRIVELASDLSATAVDVKHPLLEKRTEIKNSLLLVITSNRGLCGGYNAGILREAAHFLRGQGVRIGLGDPFPAGLHLEVSGKRAVTFCRFQGIPTEHTYTHFEDKVKFEEVDVLAARYIAEYIAGKIDRVDVAYSKFYNAARQEPVVETLLPLSNVPGVGAAGEKKQQAVDYEFLPSAASILEELLPVSFKVRLFKCFLDAAVSEQIARRVAMKAATESAADMIKSISSLYNRARQSQITKEISEIIGGAAALE